MKLYEETHRPSRPVHTTMEANNPFPGDLAKLAGPHQGPPSVDLEDRFSLLLNELDRDDKVQYMNSIFEEVHNALMTASRPAERLQKLLAPYNANFSTSGQQRVGKAALALFVARHRQGAAAVLQ